MIRGHQAAAFLRVEIERAARIEKARRARRSAPRAPRPVITSGRRADHNTSTASAIAAGSGGRPRGAPWAASSRRARGCGSHSRRAARRSESRYRPGRARRVALRPRDRLVELADHLLGNPRGARRSRHRPRISTWGMSCSGPMLACGRAVQPPISRTGTRASDALAIAVTVLVTPGPAVTMATPSVPVSSAWACAM